MLERVSGKIVDWQIEKGILSDAERAVYRYAYELLLNQVINILIAVLIAVVFGAPLPVLLLLISYIPLRSFCGGYHADTNLGCTFVSAVMIWCMCWIYQNIREGLFITYYPFIYIVSGYFVIRYAPVQDKNKPLDEAEIIRYKRMSRVLWALEMTRGVLLYFIRKRYGMVIAISHLFLSFMLIVGKLKLNKNYKCQN